MQPFWKLTALGLALALSAPAGAADAVFSQLKTFRSYFAVEGYRPVKDNFLIYYTNEGYSAQVRYTADTIAEANTAVGLPGGFSTGFAKVPSPLPYSDVPPALQPVAEALKARLVTLVPKATDFVVRWMGRYQTFQLREFIPTDAGADPQTRLAIVGTYAVKVAENSTTLEKDSGLTMMGTSRLCSDLAKSECATPPHFIDYSLPASLEGTALIAANIFNDKALSPEMQKAWKDLEKAIAKTTADLESGKYVNPINAILSRQGNTVLPVGYNQPVEFSFDVYGYPTDTTKQTVSKRKTIVVRMQDLMAKPYAESFVQDDMDILVRVGINWATGTIHMEADLGKESGDQDLPFDTTRTLVEGGNTALRGYGLVNKGQGARIRITPVVSKAAAQFREILVTSSGQISFSPYPYSMR